MSHDVFISYSLKDKAVADAVCASLEARKIRCWIAPRDVVPGMAYAEALIDGLNSSRVFVLIFSADSNKSPQVMREVERAVNKGIPIIPLRIEDVLPSKAMEYFVSSSHWLEAMTPPLEEHMQKLGDTVQILLKGETAKAPVSQLSPAAPKASNPVQHAKHKVVYIIGSLVIVALIGAVIFLITSGFGKQAAPAGTSSSTATTSSSTGSLPDTTAVPATKPSEKPAAPAKELSFQATTYTDDKNGFTLQHPTDWKSQADLTGYYVYNARPAAGTPNFLVSIFPTTNSDEIDAIAASIYNELGGTNLVWEKPESLNWGEIKGSFVKLNWNFYDGSNLDTYSVIFPKGNKTYSLSITAADGGISADLVKEVFTTFSFK